VSISLNAIGQTRTAQAELNCRVNIVHRDPTFNHIILIYIVLYNRSIFALNVPSNDHLGGILSDCNVDLLRSFTYAALDKYINTIVHITWFNQ